MLQRAVPVKPSSASGSRRSPNRCESDDGPSSPPRCTRRIGRQRPFASSTTPGAAPRRARARAERGAGPTRAGDPAARPVAVRRHRTGRGRHPHVVRRSRRRPRSHCPARSNASASSPSSGWEASARAASPTSTRIAVGSPARERGTSRSPRRRSRRSGRRRPPGLRSARSAGRRLRRRLTKSWQPRSVPARGSSCSMAPSTWPTTSVCSSCDCWTPALSVRVLATARVPLGLGGERIVALSPLPVPATTSPSRARPSNC